MSSNSNGVNLETRLMYDLPSMDNMGSTYQREFLWQVSVHANGSGTFEILVRK